MRSRPGWPASTSSTAQEVLDALREEIARERRRIEPELTVEAERRRRVEAETLREVLEAINRPGRLDETLDEVLKQLPRLVTCDSCSSPSSRATASSGSLAARGLAETLRPRRDGASATPSPTSCGRADRVLSVADVEGDPRFGDLEGLPPVRSWCGVPLLVEGEMIGILTFSRDRVDPFEDDELHAAKAVAFSAAAAIRRAELHDKVRRYAVLMEQLVAVDQAVFGGADSVNVARADRRRGGPHRELPGRVLRAARPAGPRGARHPGRCVRAGGGPLRTRGDGYADDEAPARRSPSRNRPGPRTDPACHRSCTSCPSRSEEAHVGTLALIDSDGESADDRLMESFASRAATAYLHAARGRG